MADSKELANPNVIADLANQVRVALAQAHEKLETKTVLEAWDQLKNYDLYGYDDSINRFDLKKLKGDIFVMEAVLSLFAREMSILSDKLRENNL